MGPSRYFYFLKILLLALDWKNIDLSVSFWHVLPRSRFMQNVWSRVFSLFRLQIQFSVCLFRSPTVEWVHESTLTFCLHFWLLVWVSDELCLKLKGHEMQLRFVKSLGTEICGLFVVFLAGNNMTGLLWSLLAWNWPVSPPSRWEKDLVNSSLGWMREGKPRKVCLRVWGMNIETLQGSSCMHAEVVPCKDPLLVSQCACYFFFVSGHGRCGALSRGTPGSCYCLTLEDHDRSTGLHEANFVQISR